VNELELTINGETKRLPGPATVADLLRHLDLDPRTVVVELNRKIVRRQRHQETALAKGDTIELVHFVGGG
jgi:thiamine biosynthesis protein ThiS